jgi:hypothetical protein
MKTPRKLATKLILLLEVFVLLSCLSCVKEKVPEPPVPEIEPWEKFVGKYKVYDTSGVYLFDADISHFSTINQNGGVDDYILTKLSEFINN